MLVIVLGIFICVIAINPGIVGGNPMEGDGQYDNNEANDDVDVTGNNDMNPEEKNPIAGNVIEFQTTDIEENSIDSSIFQEQELTLLNLWSINCPPCVQELPELEKIANEYKGKVRVVGIAGDTDIESVKEVLKKKGVTYTNILPGKKLQEQIINHFEYIPVTLIVNKEGKVLEKFVPGGGEYDYFKTIITELLDK